jgi:tetratricopeptide (TPR) repeat protein
MRLKLIVLIVLFSFKGLSQDNLFNLQNSKSYANYLLASGQYKSASVEFERVVFLDSTDLASGLLLLKSYRLSEDYEMSTQRASELFPNIIEMPKEHAIEYSKSLMSLRDWKQANDFWDKSLTLSIEDKTLFKATVAIFEGDFKKAQEKVGTISHTNNTLAKGYADIVDRAINGKRKSPFLAGVLSTAIPGLGKVYTGDWKDAIVSLIFTGGMAFQAVRNFNKHGVNNYRPWIYTTIGTGFYLGNIVGSVKSAKDKNRKKINKLQHEASDSFNYYF